MDDVLATLRDIAANARNAANTLESAVSQEKLVRDSIRYAKEQLRVASMEAANAAFESALIVTRDIAPTIYANNVRRAASESIEYDFDSFLQPLLAVGMEEDLYSIVPTGNGWDKSISVNLEMNQVAGDLDDYASAVESTRESMGVKEGRDPEKASYIWKTRIYGKGIYYEIIKTRLAHSTSLAPFWSLLNDGSANVSMSSDIGGTPYPSRGAHRFVNKAEEEIRKYFYLNFSLSKYRYYKDREMVEQAVFDAEYTLNELQSDVEGLAANSDDMRRFANELGVDVAELNKETIVNLARRIKNGEVLSQAQYRIGGARVRVGRLTTLLMDFGE